MERLTKAITGSAMVGVALAIAPYVPDAQLPTDPNRFPVWRLLRIPGLVLFGSGANLFQPALATEWTVCAFNILFYSALFYPLFGWLMVWRKPRG